MKKILLSIVSAVVVTVTASAGTADSKAVVPSLTPCFQDHELSFDAFGAFYTAETRKNGTNGDHGWGGGIGVNYFFCRYAGVGFEGSAFEVQSDERAAGFANINLTLRLPIEGKLCFAPYILGGGGYEFARNNSLHGHAGLGVEFRVNPKLGLFTDARYTWTGGPRVNNDFGLFRAGVRYAF